MSPGHTCRTGCGCPAARGLTAELAADELHAAQGGEQGPTSDEARVDRLRARVRVLEAERARMMALQDALVTQMLLGARRRGRG